MLSLGVTSRTSCFGLRLRGMVFVLVLWSDMYKMAIRHPFLPLGKYLGGHLTLRCTMMKEQACIINMYLSRLMRVVAMRINLEIILPIIMYHI